MMKVKDNTKKVLADIAALSRKVVVVGIPEKESARKEGPITNPQLGYIHEFGSKAAGIPKRPFLIPGVAKVQDKIKEKFRAIAKGELTLEGGLDTIGLMAAKAVQDYIKAGKGIATLADATIAARKRHSRNKNNASEEKIESMVFKALIRTRQMLNSVTYEVRDRGGD